MGIGFNQELRSAPLSGGHSRRAGAAAGYVSSTSCRLVVSTAVPFAPPTLPAHG